jgi:glutamyl-tRNA synthetase
MSKVRTRFAPSPTGSLHIGSLQKVLYSYAFAKSQGGDYILRIEDTDRNRYVEGAEEGIFWVHEQLGITPDESVKAGGPFAPYRQSERLDLYQKYGHELVEKGQAYYAFETSEELTEMRNAQQAAGERPRYEGKYRDMNYAEAKKRVDAGDKYVIRFKTPKDRELILDDIIMGKVKVNTNDVDDYILLKSDGFATYHLAMLVDDHLMEISHIFRGVEWLPTYPIHYLLFEAMGWVMPAVAHIPNILDPKGGKLSKRSGSVAVEAFLAEGYLVEAIINFMFLLGWSPKTEQELYSLQDFVKMFKLENFNKSNPVFDRNKLNWFNGVYIRQLSEDQLLSKFDHWLSNYLSLNAELSAQPIVTDIKNMDHELLKKILKLEQERVVVLSDYLDRFEVFLKQPASYDYEHKLTKKLTAEEKKSIITAFKETFAAYPEFPTHEVWEADVRGLAENSGIKAGQFFMTLRIAITGKQATPPLYEVMEVLGKEEVLTRLENSIGAIE